MELARTAEPIATVQIADSHCTVRAREVVAEEREKIWQAIADKNSDYEQYRT